jgi:hypothetical protein
LTLGITRRVKRLLAVRAPPKRRAARKLALAADLSTIDAPRPETFMFRRCKAEHALQYERRRKTVR